MKEEILLKEEAFHDKWADGVHLEDVHPVEFCTACTAPENRWIISRLGSLKGKKILELGCGLGEASVYFAMCGADVTATDLSEGMLAVASGVAKQNGVKISTAKCSADQLPFDDKSFDIVYAANILHHVDIAKTLDEAKRVLKKGGQFASWDPLAHNPVINIYRKMAMSVRTADEHPLKMRELEFFKNRFETMKYQTTWFFTLAIFLKYYFIDHVDIKGRYWKKIIKDADEIEPIYNKLEKWDKKFLKVFPFFKRYCWNIAIVCKK